VLQWSRQPHHRRRRLGAILGLTVLAVAVVLFTSGSGQEAHRIASSSSFFGRVRTLSGRGPGSLIGAREAAQSGAINRVLAYTPYVRVAGRQHRELALTFDDGPGPYTPAIIAILRREKVPATFFEVGLEEHYFHDSTSEIAALGYTIGDHTFSHAPMSLLSPRDQRNQLLTDTTALMRYGASFPRLFRPPYGMWNHATLALLHRYRMLMVLWTVDTSDYRHPGAKKIFASAVSAARPGAIILLHDAGGNRTETVAALPRIIRTLHARGYRLVTVPQLLLDNPPPAQQQISSVIGSGG
jgi:peptidoglycan/xylan/chitin deacetylase (PgdA/CDA1 family)